MNKLKPPKTIKVGGNSVRIIKDVFTDGTYGMSDSKQGWIRYDSSLSPTQERSTLLHEALHQMLDIYYLNHLVPRKNRECLVLGLEIALFSFIKDNPEFMKYLTSKGN